METVDKNKGQTFEESPKNPITGMAERVPQSRVDEYQRIAREAATAPWGRSNS